MCVNSISKFFIFSLLLSVVSSAARAEETPADPKWQDKIEASEWVALVRVESVHSLVSPAMSHHSELTAVQGYNYTLSVLRDWKGSSGQNKSKLRIDLSDCPVLMVLDTDYVVFANTNYRGHWQLKSCQHFVPLSEAASLVSLLNHDQNAIGIE